MYSYYMPKSWWRRKYNTVRKYNTIQKHIMIRCGNSAVANFNQMTVHYVNQIIMPDNSYQYKRMFKTSPVTWKLSSRRKEIRSAGSVPLSWTKGRGLYTIWDKEYMPSCSNPDIYPKTNIVWNSILSQKKYCKSDETRQANIYLLFWELP